MAAAQPAAAQPAAAGTGRVESARVQIAIIGAGTAGLQALEAARRHTDDVVLIEGGPLGTTCARVGCMPSRLLIVAARAAAAAGAAGAFGIQAAPPGIDGAAVMARVQRLRDRFVADVVERTQALGSRHLMRAWARYLGPNRLALEPPDPDQRGHGPALPREIQAQHIIIATGSRPQVPPPLRGVGDRVHTTDTLFDLATLPRRLLVVGGGPVGSELALALARLGVETCLLDMGHQIAGLGDPQVNACARQLFSRVVDLQGCSRIVAAEPGPEGVSVEWEGPQGRRDQRRVDLILAATGRTPRLDRLDLARVGLELDDHGVPVHDPVSRRCGAADIYLAGDADGVFPVLHAAAAGGRQAGHLAASGDSRAPRMPPPALTVVYTEPQVARVGPGLGALEAEGRDLRIGQTDWARQGRAIIDGHGGGLLRLYADGGTGVLLGAEMVGPAAEHLAHLLAHAVQAGLTAAQLLERPFYHPSYQEGLQGALRQVLGPLDG